MNNNNTIQPMPGSHKYLIADAPQLLLLLFLLLHVLIFFSAFSLPFLDFALGFGFDFFFLETVLNGHHFTQP